jgi:hypothetical protein
VLPDTGHSAASQQTVKEKHKGGGTSAVLRLPTSAMASRSEALKSLCQRAADSAPDGDTHARTHGHGRAQAAASHLCACIGSPCLRQCVHGAPVGGGGGGSGARQVKQVK